MIVIDKNSEKFIFTVKELATCLDCGGIKAVHCGMDDLLFEEIVKFGIAESKSSMRKNFNSFSFYAFSHEQSTPEKIVFEKTLKTYDTLKTDKCDTTMLIKLGKNKHFLIFGD